MPELSPPPIQTGEYTTGIVFNDEIFCSKKQEPKWVRIVLLTLLAVILGLAITYCILKKDEIKYYFEHRKIMKNSDTKIYLNLANTTSTVRDIGIATANLYQIILPQITANEQQLISQMSELETRINRLENLGSEVSE